MDSYGADGSGVLLDAWPLGEVGFGLVSGPALSCTSDTHVGAGGPSCYRCSRRCIHGLGDNEFGRRSSRSDRFHASGSLYASRVQGALGSRTIGSDTGDRVPVLSESRHMPKDRRPCEPTRSLLDTETGRTHPKPEPKRSSDGSRKGLTPTSQRIVRRLSALIPHYRRGVTRTALCTGWVHQEKGGMT